MTLHQKVSAVVGQWQGLDATERTNLRDQMVSEVIALVMQETQPTNGATAASVAAVLGTIQLPAPGRAAAA
jgi:hypothetical protein